MAINLGTIFAQIGLDTSLLRAGVSKANAQMKRADKSIGGFIKRNQKAMLGFGAAGVAAVGAIGVASIKMAGDFDQAMRNVNTITKLTEEQFSQLKEEVIDLSKEVPLTTAELTEGLFNVASAGVEAADQMNFLTTSSRAAVAGQANLATTVKGLTGVIKGYGDEFANADKVADLFFKTNELGVTTFEELAGSMGKVVPIASALGVTQEELFASMATLTGVTGSTAEVVTQLKAAFTNLVKPTADAQKIAKDLGISFDATSIQTLGLAGFLDQIQVATGGNVETMGKLFGSVEGLGAILALTGSSSEKFASNLDAMGNAAGAATDAFSEQQKGLNNQLKILKNNVSAIALDLGGKILPALTKFTTKINELDEETKDNIATTAEWGLGIVGVSSAISILLVVGKRFLAFLGPIGRTITLVVGATVLWNKAASKLAETIDNELGKAIVDNLGFYNLAKDSFNTIRETFIQADGSTLNWIESLFQLKTSLFETSSVTEDAIIKTDVFTGSLQAEKIAMMSSAEGLRIRTERQNEMIGTLPEATKETDTFAGVVAALGITAFASADNIHELQRQIDNLTSKDVHIRVFQDIIVNGRLSRTFATSTGVTTPIIVNPTPQEQAATQLSIGESIRLLLGFQRGGITPFGGQFLVGEKGPEVVNLPQGTQVTPNNQINNVQGEQQEIVIPVTVNLDGEVLFESVERVANVEEFRRID